MVAAKVEIDLRGWIFLFCIFLQIKGIFQKGPCIIVDISDSLIQILFSDFNEYTFQASIFYGKRKLGLRKKCQMHLSNRNAIQCMRHIYII